MFIKLKFRSVIGYNFYSSTTKAANSVFQLNSKITSHFKKRDVKSARKVFDEVPHKNVVTWNCMISGYIKNRMIVEAREAFDSMPAKNVVSWTAMLSGYAKNGQLEEARKLFDLIEKKNEACWNSMILGYVSCGEIDEARKLFDEMPLKNDVSWATMIEAYFQQGSVKKAESLFNEASSESVFLCNAMLAGYAETGDIDELNDLFMKMGKHDVASWTCMMKGFIRVGELDKARSFFDSMPDKDAIAWTVMINGYSDHGRIEPARELFDKMPHRDFVAWNSMLTGFVRNGDIKNAFDIFTRMPHKNVVSWNLMLWGYIQQDDINRARKVFDEMPRRDETSWNTMISGYQTEEALVLFVRMLSDGLLRPDQGTLTAVISVCGVLAKKCWGQSMHVFVINIGFANDSVVTSSLISMYSRCGFLNDADLVFETLKNRDTISWNALIVAKAHHSLSERAFDLFHRMIEKSECLPDHVTFLVLLTACAYSGRVSEGLKYFKLMEKYDLTPGPEHVASVVDLISRSGLLDEAFGLINRLPSDLVVNAYETLLHACSVHENYELSDLIKDKISGLGACGVDMRVLQSNIYSARGMWKDAESIRAKLRRDKLMKEAGCSWIDINGSVSCFSCYDKSHVRTEEIYRELEGIFVLVEELGSGMRRDFVS